MLHNTDFFPTTYIYYSSSLKRTSKAILLFLALEGILFLTRWLYLSILAFFSSLRTNLQICFEDLYLSSSNSGSLANTPDCRYTVVPLSSSGVSNDPPLLTSLTLSEEPESPFTTMHDLPLSLLRAY